MYVRQLSCACLECAEGCACAGSEVFSLPGIKPECGLCAVLAAVTLTQACVSGVSWVSGVC